MNNIEYISDDENLTYISREVDEKYATKGTKGRTREKQTTDNVINMSLFEISNHTSNNIEDTKELDSFKALSYQMQLDVLLHMLRIQSSAIRKAIDNKVSIALPYLGRFKYNRYREMALSIFRSFKEIDNLESIRTLIRTSIVDEKRSKTRVHRRNKLSIRKHEYPIDEFTDLGNKRDYIDERYYSDNR